MAVIADEIHQTYWPPSAEIPPKEFWEEVYHKMQWMKMDGKIACLGKSRQCTFYSLNTNHSYGQVIAASATNKIVPVIAGQADIQVPDEELAQYLSQNDREGESNRAQRWADDYIDHEAESLYVQFVWATVVASPMHFSLSLLQSLVPLNNLPIWGQLADVVYCNYCHFTGEFSIV